MSDIFQKLLPLLGTLWPIAENAVLPFSPSRYVHGLQPELLCPLSFAKGKGDNDILSEVAEYFSPPKYQEIHYLASHHMLGTVHTLI